MTSPNYSLTLTLTCKTSFYTLPNEVMISVKPQMQRTLSIEDVTCYNEAWESMTRHDKANLALSELYEAT